MSIYIRKDHWTPTEDKIVKAAVMKYGTNQWSRVASLLVRKSAAQCKARWREHLSPRLTHRDWMPREDSDLMRLSREMPNMWRSISATLGDRTAAQCFERWTYLNSTQNSERVQELLEDEVDARSEESEVNSDSERQMMAEAKARLSNSLGKKANRKQRERLEDEERFQKSIEDHRATGSAIKVKRAKGGTDYTKDIPIETLPLVADDAEPVAQNSSPQKASARRPGRERTVPRRSRQRLVLSNPTSSKRRHYFQDLDMESHLRFYKALSRLPHPKSRMTLASLASSLMDDEDYETDKEAVEKSDSDDETNISAEALDALLKNADVSLPISSEARRLVEEEASRQRRLDTSETADDATLEDEVRRELSPLGHKYEQLQHRLTNVAALLRS